MDKTTVISTPLNLIFAKRKINNVWGNALFCMLENANIPKVVAVGIFLGMMIIFFPQPIQAADVNYTRTIYTGEDGLKAGEANAIVETSDGYIWIGTYAGLYRYDGRNFDVMNFDSVKNVNRLYVDAQGRLWIGTNDKGVSIYENGEIIAVIDKSSGLPSNSVRCIGESGDGRFYIGTSSSLCVVSGEDFQISKVIPQIIYANNITVNDEGKAAIVTNGGELFFINGEEITGDYYSSEEKLNYTTSTYSADGSLYIATSSNQILVWNHQTQNAHIYADTGSLTYIHSISEDDDGNLWICSDTGIGYISDGKFEIVDTGMFNSSVDSMIRDYQGNYWFASSRMGVLKLSKNSFDDIYDQCGCKEKVVNSAIRWRGKLYSGTDQGLDIINLEKKEKISNDLTEQLETVRIRCLFVDADNNLWIATSAAMGLVQVTPDDKITVYNSDNGTLGERFRSTIQLEDGTIAAAENTGLDFIKDGKVIGTLGEQDGLANPQILSMLQMDEHTLYAGSDGEGIMVIQNQKVVDKIDEDDGLPSGVILRMTKINDGVMIVTSNSLCYMDAKGKITELKNFPYSNNYDVIEASEDKLWVLGSSGIYIVEKEPLLAGEELNYELLDSRKGLNTFLTANSWNYVEGTILYFAGNSGVYSVDMNNYMVYSDTYCMMAEYLKADNNNQVLMEGKTTVLSKDLTRITIRPELLNYTLNDPYVRYYLEGIDEKPYLVQQSSVEDISYTNLSAGNYIFHMDVLDNSGSHVLQSHTYNIYKEPQFWEHAWFKICLFAICTLGIAYVTWMITVVRGNKVIEQQKREIAIAKRQAEMGNQTILAIAKTVDAKDVNTSKHSERVSQYSVLIAERLGWTKQQCENLRQIALLHDIGKIGIPDAILNKPSKLTEEEYNIMKSHVEKGAEILKDFTLVENVTDGVKYHHEKYDGTGYVKGLKGEDIPLNARIICIADSFDAMTSNRVYRKHMDMEYVINELKRCRGTQFDPNLIDIFLDLIEKGEIDDILSK